MSIDRNNYIEAALEVLKGQIDEVNAAMNRIWEVSLGYSQDDMEQLEKLLRTACDSVEILQSYNGQFDRLTRPCWGNYPGYYEVQCRLCEVQRLCSEETDRRTPDIEDLPECFRKNPLQSQPRCWHCSLFRFCLEEARNKDNQSSQAKDE